MVHRLRLIRMLGAGLWLTVLAACTTAQSPGHTVARATGFATDRPPAADFVEQSRPQDPGYISVTQPPPAQPKPKTAEELKRVESELQGLRARHGAAAGATQTP